MRLRCKVCRCARDEADKAAAALAAVAALEGETAAAAAESIECTECTAEPFSYLINKVGSLISSLKHVRKKRGTGGPPVRWFVISSPIVLWDSNKMSPWSPLYPLVPGRKMITVNKELS